MSQIALKMNVSPPRDWPEARTGERALAEAADMEGFLAGIERRAFRLAELALGDAEDALDAVQDAMLRLVRHYAAKPAEEWAPLFYGILRRRIVDIQRRRSIQRRILGWRLESRTEDGDGGAEPVESLPGPVQDDPPERLAGDQTMRALGRALRELPARQQQAFMLRMLEGLDVAQTATAMGCSEGSVKTHLSRAMTALRERLEDYR